MENSLPNLTMPQEVAETDTGMEVHVQDGEEHVAFNSMANAALKGDVGVEKQGEKSQEGTRPAPLVAAPGASYLHPLVLEESESDSEDQTWIIDPSSSPEGSLLRAMYLELLGFGFDEISVRELFRRHEVRKWWKAIEKLVVVLPEPEMEHEEMHRQSLNDMQMPSQIGNHDDDPIGKQLQQQIPEKVSIAASEGSSAREGQNWTQRDRSQPLQAATRSINTTCLKRKGSLKNRLE